MLITLFLGVITNFKKFQEHFVNSRLVIRHADQARYLVNRADQRTLAQVVQIKQAPICDVLKR